MRLSGYFATAASNAACAKRAHHAIASALRVKSAKQTLPTVQPKMINVWRSFNMTFKS